MGRLEIRERDLLIFALGLAVFIALISTLITDNRINSLHARMNSLQNEYAKALSLYQKIKNTSQTGKRFDGSLLMFVQKLQPIAGLKKKIVSVSSLPEENGVRIVMSGLNLSQLVDVLQVIDSYSNIRVLQFTLKKNFANPDLADITVVIGKNP